MQEIALQSIIGTCPKNPLLSVLRERESNKLHIYYGVSHLETVQNDPSHITFRTCAGRLYNAGLSRKSLSHLFGVDRRTLRRWGNALKHPDPAEALRILCGRGRYKMTPEVIQFARSRFFSIYPENHYSYSKQIRNEIEECFETRVSSETFRPFFGTWKKEIESKARAANTRCDEEHQAGTQEHVSYDCNKDQSAQDAPPANGSGPLHKDTNRTFTVPFSSKPQLIRHAGVCIFAHFIARIRSLFTGYGQIVAQWLCMLYLEAVAIEQSKYLDFHSLTRLLGPTVRLPLSQRRVLAEVANEDQCTKIFRLNAELCTIHECLDFYYDPHAKHYTGQFKILKGWCASIGHADKVLYSDFIHSSKGEPLFMIHCDNYYDLRERYRESIKAFRTSVALDPSVCITMVLDRGIFKSDVFEETLNDPSLELITWEKDFKSCEELWVVHQSEYFFIEKYRNSSKDTRRYTFRSIDIPWEKNPRVRRLVVQATNYKNKMVEVGVLATDKKRAAQDIIRLIFNRWIQENDFKYLDKHYGINQITSYDTIDYKELKQTLTDKEVASGEYKGLHYEKTVLTKKLKDLLYKKHCRDEKMHQAQKRLQAIEDTLNAVVKRPPNLQSKKEMAEMRKKRRSLKAAIGRWNKSDLDEKIKRQSDLLEKAAAQVEKQKEHVSKLDSLVMQGYMAPDVRKKRFMDALKIFARNTFYLMFQPFRDKYDDFRDDHEYFRNLTHADGVYKESEKMVEIMLHPSAHLQPKTASIIQKILEALTATSPVSIDNSGKKLKVTLCKNKTLELANLAEGV
jgi:hypothetical protein